MEIICAGCGKVITKNDDVEGSYKHPYCKKCFKKVWDDDYNKYFAWLKSKRRH